MEGTHKVYLERSEAGNVQVSRKGLYFHFLCSVHIPKGSYYHLYAVSENDNIDLGLCVPIYNDFGLSTKQPMKLFPSDKYSFRLAKKMNDDLIRIDADKPFKHLHRLKNGQLIVRDGIAAVKFSDGRESF